MTKAEKREDDVLNGIVLTIKRLVKERDEAKDELEKAQAVVDRVNSMIHTDVPITPQESFTKPELLSLLMFCKYGYDGANCLAPLKPDYAQMVDDDKTALEDA